LKREDPERDKRLYFSKSYIYPLIAAPFIVVFGTNGFLVLHAFLLAFDLLVIYLFVLAATKSNWAAVPMSIAFLGASVVPVYLVWLMPELLNFSLVLYAVFFWAYKKSPARPPATPLAPIAPIAAIAPIVTGPASDYIAAFLIGLATFSKPPHVIVLVPAILLAARRREWTRAAGMLVVCGAVTAALFALNVAITGEFNYQGGDRKTFYSFTGYPFANTWETFDNIGPVRGREDLMVGRRAGEHAFIRRASPQSLVLPCRTECGTRAVLLPGDARRRALPLLEAETSLAMAVAGNAGPSSSSCTYSCGRSLERRRRAGGQPLLPSVLCAVSGADSGDGGLGRSDDGGHRRRVLHRAARAEPFLCVAAAWGAHQIRSPADAADRADAASRPSLLRRIALGCAGRWVRRNRRHTCWRTSSTTMPIRLRRPLPSRSDWWFWVKGNSTSEVVLRAPIASLGNNDWVTKALSRVTLEVRNGGADNPVTVATGSESQTFAMTPGELRVVTLAVPAGVPFRREIQPTSYLYNLSVTTTAGFVPFLEVPCAAPGKCPSSDPRFLGAMIHVVPEYTDADITRAGCRQAASRFRKRETRVGYSTHLEAKVARKVTKAIHDFNLIEDGDRVMVGLSGGKDSWALIQILDVLRKRAPINFSIIGVNIDSGYEDFQHGTIKGTCEARGWECHVEHTNIGDVMDDLLAANSTPCSLCARPAPRRALSPRRQSRRDENRAGPSRRRLHRNAAPEPVLRGQPQGDACEAGV
jgi:hypothetical protein